MQSHLKLPGRAILVTHTLFYGASEALRDYLVSHNIESLTYLAHPLLSENSTYTVKKFMFGDTIYEKVVKRTIAGTILSYIRDMWVTFMTCVALPKGPYTYIGVNPLNACVGVLLRAMGKVDKVIFYAIDFIPKRSSLAIINYIYHALESFAVQRSDVCWNVSPRIEEGRKEYLNLITSKNKQLVVPIGIWQKDIIKKIKTKNDYRLIFVGHLLEKQGVQEVIRALPVVVKKIPKVTFTIIGGGEYEQSLRDLVVSLSLQKRVRFMGWQSDQTVIRREISRSDIAVATYMPSGKDTTNFSYYADPTKIKTYLSCGVPVMMTNVAYNAKKLEREGVAIVVPYISGAISLSFTKIFQDNTSLQYMKKKSIQCANNFRWESIFRKAFAYV